MENTKKPDINSDTLGICSAPATVANNPFLRTEWGSSPTERQAELHSLLKASNSSWEIFDIIDAAQMDLASNIKETWWYNTHLISFLNTRVFLKNTFSKKS